MDEYALTAPAYDPVTAWALDPTRRELAGLAASLGAGTALDVCCGTGRQCLFLARAGVRATGLDLSPAMLAQAARRSAGFGLVLGDALALPFPDASFDFTAIALALHEKPPADRPAILAGMLRVTRPGGTVAVVDYLAPETAGQRALSLGITALERLAGRDHHAHYAHFMAAGGLSGFLRGQGLAPPEIRRRMSGLLGLAVLRV